MKTVIAALACVLGCAGAQAGISYVRAQGSFGCYEGNSDGFEPGCEHEPAEIRFSYDTKSLVNNQFSILKYSMHVDMAMGSDLFFSGEGGTIELSNSDYRPTFITVNSPVFQLVVDAYDNLAGKYLSSDMWLGFLTLGASTGNFNDYGWINNSGFGPFVVPVPGTAWLTGLGLLGLVGFTVRKASATNGRFIRKQ